MKQGNKIVSYVVLLSIVFVVIQTASLFGLFRISLKAVEKIVARNNLLCCINSLQAMEKYTSQIAPALRPDAEYVLSAYETSAAGRRGKPCFNK